MSLKVKQPLRKVVVSTNPSLTKKAMSLHAHGFFILNRNPLTAT